jgi:electron transport complex protein RnfD
MEIVQEKSPHIRRNDSVSRMMLDVLIALSPVIIYSFCAYGVYALQNYLVSIITMLLSEFVFVLIKNRVPYDGEKHTLKEHFLRGVKAYRLANVMVPLVSAVIYALIMPTRLNSEVLYYVCMISGALFGIILGKLVYGGTGQNIFNPAAVGMVFTKLCFSSHFVTYEPFKFLTEEAAKSAKTVIGASATASATALPGLVPTSGTLTETYSMLELFLGQTPGLMGEACKLAILIGLVYLIVRHTIDWRIPLSYVLTVAVLMLFAGLIYHNAGYTDASGNVLDPFQYVGYQILSGGLLFGAVFMATDPVTSPVTRPSRVIYGIILGISTSLIRLFGTYPEGVIFSLLIGNMVTPLLDYYKWSASRWNWKKLVAAASVAACGLLVIVWALCVEVF